VFIYGAIVSDIELNLLGAEFVPFLQGRNTALTAVQFQQHDARSDAGVAIILFHHDLFKRDSLSNCYPVLFEERLSWSLYFADLNPRGYLWSHL
jgi:hypothetical protein